MQGIPGTAAANLATEPKNVGLLLPSQGQFADSASAIRNGFFAAYYYDKQTSSAVSNVSVLNTNDPNVQAAYAKAVQNGANFIVGPLTKPEVQQIAHSPVEVPTLALNSLDASQSASGNLYFFSLSPRDEAIQVAQKASADGHHNAIIIAPATPWGQSTASAFAQAWQNTGGHIVGNLAFGPRENLFKPMANLLQVDKSVISSKGFRDAQKKKIPLDQLRRNDFDMVFLAASPSQARLIKPLLNFYFAGNIPVYATSSVYSGNPAPQYDNDLNGVIFCDMPWVLESSNQLSPAMRVIKSNINSLWSNSNNYAKLYAMGVDAYYLTIGLAKLASGASIEGATGTLSMGPRHQIIRRLTWAQFRNGVPVTL